MVNVTLIGHILKHCTINLYAVTPIISNNFTWELALSEKYGMRAAVA